MNNDYMKLQDIATYKAELKGFDWNYENRSHEAWQYGHRRRYQLECAAAFSPAHQEVWAEYEKKHALNS